MKLHGECVHRAPCKMHALPTGIAIKQVRVVGRDREMK